MTSKHCSGNEDVLLPIDWTPGSDEAPDILSTNQSHVGHFL